MVHDPLGDPHEAHEEYKIELTPLEKFTRARRADPRGRAQGVHRRTSTAIFARVRDGGVRDRREERAATGEAAARHPALEPLSDRARATTKSARIWSTRRGGGSSPASPASSARRCSRSCSISARPSSASTTSSPATRRTSTTSSSINPDERLQFQFIEGDLRDPEVAQQACKDVDIVLHQAALGSVPRSMKDPIASHQHNVDAFLNVLVGARRTPACSASSTRRARRCTAITRGCRSTRTGSASRCRRTRRPSASTRSTRRCSRTATACR